MNTTFEKCFIGDEIVLSALKTTKFKTAVLKLSIAMPASVDERDSALFALMINVLKCGTEKYPERSDIIKRLGDLYDASCSIGGYASGDNRILEISSEMLSDRFSDEGSIIDGVAELIDQLLYHPNTDDDGLFLSETIEREKQVLCDKIKSEKNNSRAYALKRCREIMCAGEPYGNAVKSEFIVDITARELTEYYKTFLSRSVPSFSYVGDMSITDVSEVIKKHFADERIGTADPILPLSCSVSSEICKMNEDFEIKQGILVIGFRSGILLGDQHSNAMRVFNNVFGGTSTSRLFTIIREKMGLCYYCDSDYVSTKGLLFVCSGIDSDKRETVESEILKQLEALRDTPVGTIELDNAKDLAIKELYEICDYQASIASFKYAYEIYGIDSDINRIISEISSVTANDIMEIASNITLDTIFFLNGTGNGEEELDD